MIAYRDTIFVSPRFIEGVEQLFGREASEALAYAGHPNVYVDSEGKICTHNHGDSYFNGWFVFRIKGEEAKRKPRSAFF